MENQNNDNMFTDELLYYHKLYMLKQNLADTDYKAIKFAEGEISADEYEPIKLQRREWRKQINELEEK